MVKVGYLHYESSLMKSIKTVKKRKKERRGELERGIRVMERI
jgi:hypothetical protein